MTEEERDELPKHDDALRGRTRTREREREKANVQHPLENLRSVILSLRTISSEGELVLGVVASKQKREGNHQPTLRFVPPTDSTRLSLIADSLLLEVKNDSSCLENREIVPVGIDDGRDSTVGVDLCTTHATKEKAKSASSESEGRRGERERGKIGADLDEPRLFLSVLADVDSVGVVGETGVGGFELFEEDGHLCERRERKRSGGEGGDGERGQVCDPFAEGGSFERFSGRGQGELEGGELTLTTVKS